MVMMMNTALIKTTNVRAETATQKTQEKSNHTYFGLQDAIDLQNEQLHLIRCLSFLCVLCMCIEAVDTKATPTTTKNSMDFSLRFDTYQSPCCRVLSLCVLACIII